MFDGDVHAFHIAQNRAALFLQGCGEVSYFGGRGVKELVKLFAESRVVGRDRGQHPRMVERRIQRLLELPDPGDDLRLEQRVQVVTVLGLLLQGIEAPQQLHMLLGQRGDIAVGQNFDQRNLEGRKRQRTIEPVAAALPLPGHARMAIKKCGHQVGLVAIYVAGIFLAGEIAQDGFGDFGIGFRRECPPQHGRRNGLIEQAQPAPHAVERGMHFAIALLQ